MTDQRDEERVHTESLVREHEGIAWSLLDTKAEAVIVVDPNGTIHCANESAARRFGVPVGELIGSSVWALYPSHRVNHHRILFGEALRTGDSITARSRDGDRWSQMLIYPVRREGQSPSRIALCTWDVTEIAEAQERYKRTALELITAQEDERHRISRDLHDDIGQRLTALALELRAVERALESGQERALDEVRITIQDLEMIAKHTRQIAYQLYPPSLGKVTLPKVLSAFCASFESSTGLNVDFNCQEEIPEIPDLPAIAVYRFVQEGLSNTARHAWASRAWVSLDYTDGDLNISLEDDGKGFDPARVLKGMGLPGIRERFQMLNGSIEVESAPGKGTRLSGTLPFTHNASSQTTTGAQT
jgi:PAS domain S-box-containing protein